MTKRLTLAIALAGIALVAVLWLRPESLQPQNPLAHEQSARPASASPPDNDPAIVNAAREPTPQTETTSTTDPTGTFRIDGTGHLVIDEQTRLNMEALFARTDAADLAKVHEEITQALPPAAAAEASALLERYQNYSKAQRQAYPPGAAPATEEAALAELEGLHALRIAHFGSENAQALYGAEETLTRSLIELMRLEKDQSLTLEEKAARAQQLYDTLPELSRVQRSN
jgi:lipase chaperone LimK